MLHRFSPLLFGWLALYASAASAVTLTVPNASNDIATITLDPISPFQSTTGNVTANDVNGRFVTLTSPINGRYGSLTIDSNGIYTYRLYETTPAILANLQAGGVVSDVFNYNYSNEYGWSDSATLTVNIVANPVNLIAFDDEAIVIPNRAPSVSGNVTANDRNGIFAALIDSPRGNYGLLSFGSTGNYTYTLYDTSPEVLALKVGEQLTETFNYSYFNQSGQSVTARLVVTIIGNPVNVTAADDLVTIIPNRTPSASGNVTTNDRNGQLVALLDSSNGRYGFLNLDSSGNYTYTLYDISPEVQALQAGERLTEAFSYRYSDEFGASATARVVVTVIGNPVNVIAANDQATVIPNRTPTATGNVTANDRNGQFVELLGPSNGNYGLLNLSSNGSYTYTLYDSSPAVLALRVGQQLTETFTYRYFDEFGSSATANLVVTIVGNPVNVTAADDRATVVPVKSPTASGNVTANDRNGQFVSLLDSPNGRYGFLRIDSNGSYTYTIYETSLEALALQAGQQLTETFAYRYSDQFGASATARLIVTIVGDPANPTTVNVIAANDRATVVQNTQPIVNGNVTTNDSNGNFVSLVGSPVGNYGYLTLDVNGGYIYTLDETAPAVRALKARDLLTDTFSYTYFDQEGRSATATLTIDIIGNPVDESGNTEFDNALYENVDIEFNDSSAQATPLNSARKIKGHLRSSGDKDWFRLASNGDEIIRLEMCPSDSSCYGKKNWVLYVFDSDLLTLPIEDSTYEFRSWLQETGTVFGKSGNQLISGSNGFSNHLYLQYRLGFLDSALVGIIDPCFGTTNSVEIGVGSGAKNYLIAVSSPLRGRDDAGDSCGQGSVVLEEEGQTITETIIDDAGETTEETYQIIQEKIVAFPYSDDQYAIRITGTGVDPLSTESAAAGSATFSATSGSLVMPKIRINNELYEADLNLQTNIAKSGRDSLKFSLTYLDALPEGTEPDAFQATYNPQTLQVIVPRVTEINSGKAYSVILQYHPAADGFEPWLEVLNVRPIE
ncbi:MAG: hypothetical protein Kow0065_08000 [Methylomicrobium sp.]